MIPEGWFGDLRNQRNLVTEPDEVARHFIGAGLSSRLLLEESIVKCREFAYVSLRS